MKLKGDSRIRELQTAAYHQRIVDYYAQTEHAYADAWDLNNSAAIHYGYWDDKVHSFAQSLQRMNEVMMEAAGISPGDHVLDAGCGIGGSSIFLVREKGCRVTGISLSSRQVEKATRLAHENEVDRLVDFKVMDYCATSFPAESFDVVWGCESICYADDKDAFIKEAFRLLKPKGRLVIADGFVNDFENNYHPFICDWLNGWQVNYLESPDRMSTFMNNAGFTSVQYRDISQFTLHSARRLYNFYFLASMYLLWKKVNFSKPATVIQKNNIKACRYQYKALKKGLWQYGILTGVKP